MGPIDGSNRVGVGEDDITKTFIASVDTTLNYFQATTQLPEVTYYGKRTTELRGFENTILELSS